MDLKEFEKQQFKKFINNEKFKDWVYSSSEDIKPSKKNFVPNNTNYIEAIDKAKVFLLTVKSEFETQPLTNSALTKNYEILSKIHEKDTKNERLASFVHKKLLPYAAVILLCITIGVLYTGLTSRTSYQTTYGELKNIKLPDGSTVVLSANSKLTFEKKWKNQKNRKVWLKGEAYFNVTPKPATKAKFTVITKTINVEVLGTEFTIDNRKQKTKVALNHGKINLKIKDELNLNMIMLPGEKITYIAKSKQLPKKEKISKSDSEWQHGVLFYNNIPLQIVLDKFEAIYGTKLNLNPKDRSLLNKKITIALALNNKSIAIKTLEKTINISFSN